MTDETRSYRALDILIGALHLADVIESRCSTPTVGVLIPTSGVFPQFHSFGLTVLTLLPLAAGIKVVYASRFLPPRIIKLIRQHHPTVFIAIPSMYGALLHAKDAGPDDFKSFRYIVSGGEPLP